MIVLSKLIEWESTNNLPSLSGTPAQIMWARQIRMEVLYTPNKQNLSVETDARFWIILKKEQEKQLRAQQAEEFRQAEVARWQQKYAAIEKVIDE